MALVRLFQHSSHLHVEEFPLSEHMEKSRKRRKSSSKGVPNLRQQVKSASRSLHSIKAFQIKLHTTF